LVNTRERAGVVSFGGKPPVARLALVNVDEARIDPRHDILRQILQA